LNVTGSLMSDGTAVKAWRIGIEGVVVLLVGAVASGAGLIMLADPDTYQAVARTKVDPPVFPGPYFIQTEFEFIWSDHVLGKVIEKLNLTELWGKRRAQRSNLAKAEAIGLLKRQMDLRIVPNTEVIEIIVRSNEPVEAAKIANTIAEVFRDFRRDENRQLRIEAEKTRPQPLTGRTEISDPMVEIIDIASVPLRPVRPNRPLCATIFLFGSLLFFFGLYSVYEAR
jgi:uncharacterized protein involved in exopolysaccharide biosynthesis